MRCRWARQFLFLFLTTSTMFAVVGISISPRRAPVTLRQTQQFRATIVNTTNTGATWYVDGVHGGNTTIGTISTSGVYTSPAAAGRHTVTTRSNADVTKSASATVWVTNYPGMFTYHGDRFRSGLNAQELALSPSTVNKATFGKLFSRAVDGQIYGQPLHVANLNVSGVVRNVVYVATQHDSVYAFDADGRTTTPLWKRSLINPAAGITTMGKPASALIAPEIGITSTPVIDSAAGLMYVLAVTVESGRIVHRLHALSLTTGAEKLGGPVAIAGSSGGRTFDSSRHLQRPALLLVSGVVYVAFGSQGDALPYQGWLFGYTANSTGILHRAVAFCASPTSAAAIWMSGGGPAADSAGNIYVITWNGAYNLPAGGADTGDTFLKLAWVNGVFRIVDYFTPHNHQQLDTADWDLGSGGPYIPPTQSGAAPQLLIGGGKEAKIYVVNRQNMGKVNATADAVVQTITLGRPVPSNGIFFTPAGWNGWVYFGAYNDAIKAYRFSSGLLSSTALTQTFKIFSYPGVNPMVSANGTTGGIVWALDNSTYAGGSPGGAVNGKGPAVLHAYNASDLTAELWNSSQSGTRDTAGTAIKYVSPTIANGRVYVPGASTLTVYGLLP